MWTFVHLLLPSVILPLCRGDRKAQASKLMTDLLQGYDSRIKPDGINNKTVNLVHDVRLYQIIDVDEKNQVLDGIYWVYQQWFDKELTWNPADYDEITNIHLRDDSIWYPEIALLNEIDVEKTLKSSRTTRLVVWAHGLVQRHLSINYRSSCSMNLRRFPFDTQNCTLEFVSYRYHELELNLSTSLPFDPKFSVKHNEFNLKDVEIIVNYESECNCPYPVAKINHHIILERKPLFFMLNMLLPSILIALVAMLSFCIPPESGEKVGLGITVLLSLSVFLLIVNDQMSPTKEAPLIVIYYFVAVTIVTISTSLSVLTLSLHHMALDQVRPVPTWLRSICFGRVSRILCIRFGTEINMTTDKGVIVQLSSEGTTSREQTIEHGRVSSTGNDITPGKQSIEQELPPNIQSCFIAIEGFIGHYEESKKQEQIREIMQREWKKVARVLDRLLLISFTILSVLFTLGILVSVGSQTNQ